MHWGMEGKVTAVHGISIAAHPKEYRDRIYGLARDAGLSFVSCPTAWIDSRRKERTTWDGCMLVAIGLMVLFMAPLAKIAAGIAIAYGAWTIWKSE